MALPGPIRFWLRFRVRFGVRFGVGFRGRFQGATPPKPGGPETGQNPPRNRSQNDSKTIAKTITVSKIRRFGPPGTDTILATILGRISRTILGRVPAVERIQGRILGRKGFGGGFWAGFCFRQDSEEDSVQNSGHVEDVDQDSRLPGIPNPNQSPIVYGRSAPYPNCMLRVVLWVVARQS